MDVFDLRAKELCQDVALIRGGRLLARVAPPGLHSSYKAESLAMATA